MPSIRGSSSTMLISSVIIALLGCFVLSADAIRCHQCNSHLDEDCNGLKLAVPRGVRDDQYLADCEPQESGIKAFCRKTITTIQVSGEKRIVRSCGWNQGDLRQRNDTCLSADNEGFFQEICACFSDGCNSAPTSGRIDIAVALGVSIFMLAVTATTVRRG